MMHPSNTTLSEDEARLYDRQIRLWGVDAQQRMKQARVLVVGLRGVTSEICKNLVLAGVQQVTLLEPQPVCAAHLAAHLFLSPADIGSNRAAASVAGLSALNPLVEVRAADALLQPDQLDAEYISRFGVVVASHLPLASLVRLDLLCRQQRVRFFAVDNFGYAGYFFSDLGIYHHQAKPAVSAAQPDQGAPALVSVPFVSLAEAAEAQWTKPRPNLLLLSILALLELWVDESVLHRDVEKFVTDVSSVLTRRGLRPDLLPSDLLRQLVSHSEAELSPVAAIIGGLLAQEIIKVIAGKDEPFKSFFLYNALDAKNPGIIEA